MVVTGFPDGRVHPAPASDHANPTQRSPLHLGFEGRAVSPKPPGRGRGCDAEGCGRLGEPSLPKRDATKWGGRARPAPASDHANHARRNPCLRRRSEGRAVSPQPPPCGRCMGVSAGRAPPVSPDQVMATRGGFWCNPSAAGLVTPVFTPTSAWLQPSVRPGCVLCRCIPGLCLPYHDQEPIARQTPAPTLGLRGPRPRTSRAHPCGARRPCRNPGR